MSELIGQCEDSDLSLLSCQVTSTGMLLMKEASSKGGAVAFPLRTTNGEDKAKSKANPFFTCAT